MINWEAYITLGIIIATIAVLISDKFKTSRVFLFSSAALILAGASSTEEFMAGLSNKSILTIFILVLITAGVNESFDLVGALSKLFSKVKGPRGFILRMSTAVSGLSAFMNNTPVVAVMMPFVYEWGKSRKISPSILLLPLSFAAIMGGVITLIGTSTNLVLNGLIESAGLIPLGFFDFTIPGLIITAVGIGLLMLLAPTLLKGHEDFISEVQANNREYIIEMRVISDSELIGQSVEDAGLRNLEGFYLSEIIREDQVIAPVRRREKLEAKDVLLFAGDTTMVASLESKFPGLELSKTMEFDLKEETEVVEAIVGQNSLLDRRTAKDYNFRQKMDAAIIGIHRKGDKLSGKIGRIPLKVGDVLLIVAGKNFQKRNAQYDDLIVLQSFKTYEEMPSIKKYLFIGGTLLSVIGTIMGYWPLFEALMAILVLQVALNMVYIDLVKKSLSLDLLVILLSSLVLGDALIKTGAAQLITDAVFANASSWAPLSIIISLFAASCLLTSFVTNVAAVSIIFPIAYSLALSSGLSFEAVFLTTAFGASCSFMTPYAYQTNIMVMELGQYKFLDYLKLGLILSLMYGAIFITYISYQYL